MNWEKRLFDILASLFAMIVFFPFMIVIAIIIKCESSGPVFFSQMRVGRGGIPFRLYKFRSMTTAKSAQRMTLTVKGDMRITRVGWVLRKFKLDEIPQLVNVLIGNMSIVGPRPEVPEYMALYSHAQQEIILSVRPGLTDFAAIALRDEEEILASYPDPELAYRNILMPQKFEYYRQYVEERSLLLDLKLILRTLLVIFNAPKIEIKIHE